MQSKRMQDDWIFLYGPPGSGKSSLGRRLAKALRLPFVDLDVEIQNATSMSIPEIFAERGEDGFRGLERQAVVDTLKGQAGVVALGGGTLLDDSSRRWVEAYGPVVCLNAAPSVILRRIKNCLSLRPLLEGDLDGKLSILLKSRAAHYGSFPIQIKCKDTSLTESTWRIQTKLGRFHASGMGQGYDVRLLENSLDGLGAALHHYGLHGPLVVVSDDNVALLYGDMVLHSLSEAGYQAGLVTFPAGEQYKSISTVQNLWDGFLHHRLERGGSVIALGGGLVNDLAGFAAATFMRGVAWVAVPTSLLGMVDASLGGKTGANLPQGKNLVGAFSPPRLVWADPHCLTTLPGREIRNGMAEVVKAGIIGDPSLFEACSHGLDSLRNNWVEIISRAMAVKLRIVEEDPFEQGRRAVLNLGHTLGHALERLSGFEIAHGEAVSIGLVGEARLSEGIGLAQPGLANQIASVLNHLGLPSELPGETRLDELMAAMQVDKKRQAGELCFALPSGIGKVEVGISLKAGQILRILGDHQENYL